MAPYCDFRRYTKCCPIVVKEKESVQAARCRDTPRYKRRKSKPVPVVQTQCVVTDAEFEELCGASMGLEVSRARVGSRRSVRARGKAKPSSCKGGVVARDEVVEEECDVVAPRIRRKEVRLDAARRHRNLFKTRAFTLEEDMEYDLVRAQHQERVA